MNRLIEVLLVVVVAHSTISAQDTKSSNQSSQATEQVQTEPAKPTFAFKPTFRLQIEQASQARKTPQQTFVIGSSPFVIKDQALYLEITGNGVLIPVPGGGASGCFGWDSEKKFVELRRTFEGLPAGRQPTGLPQR